MLNAMVDISKYIAETLVLFMNEESRNAALDKLIEHIAQAGKLVDKEGFRKAIIDREKIVSTGIGMGVAIPHAKMESLNEFFIAIGILQKGVDWQSLDRSPVRLIFIIGGPDDKQTEYLHLLSSLTTAIKNEELRKKLLTLNSPVDIVKLFKFS